MGISAVFSPILLLVMILLISITVFYFLRGITVSPQGILKEKTKEIEEMAELTDFRISKAYVYTPSRGLVAYWNFNEEGSKVFDFYGKRDEGTIFGGSRGEGIFGRALVLDPDGSGFVSIPSSSDLDLTSELSIAAWINPRSTAESTVIFRRGTSPNLQYEFGIMNGYLEFSFYNGDFFQNISSGSIPTNKWSFVVVTFSDQNNEIRFYINGKLDSVRSQAGSIKSYPEGEEIGTEFNGSIDELMVFNRVLSPSEIENLFYRVHLLILNPTNKDVDLNRTLLLLNGCGERMEYGKNFITDLGSSVIPSGKIATVKIAPVDCGVRLGDNTVCIVSGRYKICSSFRYG